MDSIFISGTYHEIGCLKISAKVILMFKTFPKYLYF